MKILHVIPHFAPKYGGEVMVVYQLAKSQVNLGEQVDILSIDYDSDMSVLKGSGVNHHLVKCLLHVGLARYSADMKRWLRANISSYDIVHIHSYMSHTAIVSVRIGNRQKVPTVLQAHNALRPYGRKSALLKMFDLIWGKRIVRSSDLLLAYGDVETRAYEELGARSENISILFNGIDFQEFLNLPPRGEFRSRNGIPDDDLVFVFMGRLDRIKRVGLLIRAFKVHHGENPKSRLLVVGPDHGELSDLTKLKDELGLNDSVMFIGGLYGKDRVQALVDSDVFALTSVTEGFNIAAMEAGACGLPVILTKNSANANLISSGMGILVGDDVGEIAAAMSRMLDSKLRKDMGDFGRELAGSQLDWNIIAQKSVRYYQDLIEGKKERGP